MIFKSLFSSTVLCFIALTANAVAEVNVYSYRQPQLIEPLFKAFTVKTGIPVNMVFAEKGLVERLEQEGNLSPADVLLSSDVGTLVLAASKKLGQSVELPTLTDNIPSNMRDTNNLWFGLTLRARVVYASRDRVAQDAISYEELADPKFKGKICLRPGDHPYNLGLISWMISKQGEDKTKVWLQGLKANLATKPNGNDRAQAKAVAAGECDLAIANTYYMGLMTTNEKEPEQKEWAKATKIIFPASADLGTHFNISGMMLTAAAPHKDDALKLMEFLASDEGQQIYAAGNFEYPVNPKVQASEVVKSWGPFTPDPANVEAIAQNMAAASRMVEELNFNN